MFRPILPIALAAVFSFLTATAFSQPAAEEAPALDSQERLAAIYAGSVPKNIDDLLAMEKQQRELAKKLIACTVGVRVGNAQGSGVVISRDGYVLTAAHVIGKPNKNAFITFPDGKTVRAKTMGLNRTVDGGLLKISEEGDWAFTEMGSSDDLLAGQWVFVTGHPGGYLSDRKPVVRLGRVLTSANEAIITDCPLVGGDSGGPLFDADGKVIGINSRIGVALTQNIHVPIDTYRNTWDRLTRGEAWGYLPGHRPMIGVQGQQDADDARISKVFENSPAEKAGIEVGDTIIEFGGKRITDFGSLSKLVKEYMPGDRVDLKVRRGDQELKLRITIGRQQK